MMSMKTCPYSHFGCVHTVSSDVSIPSVDTILRLSHSVASQHKTDCNSHTRTLLGVDHFVYCEDVFTPLQHMMPSTQYTRRSGAFSADPLRTREFIHSTHRPPTCPSPVARDTPDEAGALDLAHGDERSGFFLHARACALRVPRVKESWPAPRASGSLRDPARPLRHGDGLSTRFRRSAPGALSWRGAWTSPFSRAKND